MTSCDNDHLSVSVIIPTYNRAAFIATAVESALNQTRRPDEILVVDDGSTDGTADLLKQFDAPVRVIRQKNRGRSAARNAGLRVATGDAVIFLDSDDTLLPECIECCARVLEAHPEVGVVYADAQLVDAQGGLLHLYSQALPGLRPSGMVLAELARRNFLTIASLFRRKCASDVAFEEGMECAEDYDFWRQLAVRCQFHYVDKPLMRYRIHDAMTVTNQLADISTGEAEVLRRIIEMPEFAQLAKCEQARAFCVYGIKLAMLGRTSMARSYFSRSVRTAPAYFGVYPLWLLSLFGTRALQFAILKRRRLAGNRLGSSNGMSALLQHPAPVRQGLGAEERRRKPGKRGIMLATGEAT